ncbi:MAG: hypothetical protein IJY67_00380 [Paludibacteraceae bacterium]|nr:hypothetical protein [Paludibacteraceae bacterium]
MKVEIFCNYYLLFFILILCNSCETSLDDITYEYVDLGLSVKWATCNIGAKNPEDFGAYFAWGEIKSKKKYTWDNYKHCVDSYDNLTKYCTKSGYGYNGFVDYKCELEAEDDAATMICGQGWRMPTDLEIFELRQKCKWIWTNQEGVNGYKVVGPNGKSIFFPAAGSRGGSKREGVGEWGGIWSKSLDSSKPNYALTLDFNANLVEAYYEKRGFGQTIRPVCP